MSGKGELKGTLAMHVNGTGWSPPNGVIEGNKRFSGEDSQKKGDSRAYAYGVNNFRDRRAQHPWPSPSSEVARRSRERSRPFYGKGTEIIKVTVQEMLLRATRGEKGGQRRNLGVVRASSVDESCGLENSEAPVTRTLLIIMVPVLMGESRQEWTDAIALVVTRKRPCWRSFP